MLTQISLKNFLLIDLATVDLRSGLTALTGETGAGKSLILDALQLLLGQPGGQTLIKKGTNQSQLTAVFDISQQPQAQAWLDERGWLENPHECILTRTLTQAGRSRATINGQPCPLSALKAFGECVVSLHSQHHQQRITTPTFQRTYLDRWGQTQPALEATATAYQDLVDAQARVDHWQAISHAGQEQLELVNYFVDELEKAAIEPGEVETLHNQHRLAHQQSKIHQALEALSEALRSSQKPAAIPLLLEAQQWLEKLPSDHNEHAQISQCLETAWVALDEAESTLDAWRRSLEAPVDLDAINKRLQQLHDLARKHRLEPENLPDKLAELQGQRQAFEQADQALQEAQQTWKDAWERYQHHAQTLHQLRQQHAASLEKTLSESLPSLGLPAATFEVRVHANPERPSASGWDEVLFTFAANRGSDLQPLGDAASGGERSRLALLLASLRHQDQPTTLIFDEIDTGISGQTAATVGQLLHRLGQCYQALCITHLAQVAAHADHHVAVQKEHHATTTDVHLQPLSGKARTQELARLLSGQDITPTALKQAQHLLREAQT